MLLYRLVNNRILNGTLLLLIFVTVGVFLLAFWQTKEDAVQLDFIRQELIATTLECPPAIVLLEEMNERVSWAKKKYPLVCDLPAEFSDAFYYALSYYPELQRTPIEFVYETIATTLQVQPSPATLFAKADQRTYRVFINSDRNFDGVLFADVPLNAQVGVLAHELAHMVDYQNKNFFQLLGTALKFTNTKAQSSYEKSIDLLTIYKGFGQHIHDWTYYLENESSASTRYRAFKNLIYYSNAEIVSLLSTHNTICD